MQCGGGCMRKLQRVDVVAMYQNDRQVAAPAARWCLRLRDWATQTCMRRHGTRRSVSAPPAITTPASTSTVLLDRQGGLSNCSTLDVAPDSVRSVPPERQGIVSQQQLESGQIVCVFQGNWPFWSSTPPQISGLAGRLVEGASDKTISLFSCMWHLSATLYGMLTL